MKLIAILRIKNAILTIEECLTNLSQLCDEIVIVDNGSTDGTLAVYKRFPKIVKIAQTRGFDESRDRNLVLALARRRRPDWLLWIDADEVFEPKLAREVLEKYMVTPGLNRVRFRMFNFWLSKEKFRVDSKWLFYTARPQRSMWRDTPEAHFSERKFHGGEILGIEGKSIVSPYRIKHFGYVGRKQIEGRNRRNAKLTKKYPFWDKTMTTSVDDKVLLISFVDGVNLFLEKLKWDIIEKCERK